MKDPRARYRSTQDIIGDLERLHADRSAGTTSPDVAPPPHRGSRSRQWLINHHVIMSVVYVVLIYPTWFAHGWLPAPWNSGFLLAVLAAAAAGTSLRLHVWFTAIALPHQLAEQQASTQRWTRISDVLFASVLIAAALRISEGHREFAMLFITVSVAIAVASFIIEPATVRAALGPPAVSERRRRP